MTCPLPGKQRSWYEAMAIADTAAMPGGDRSRLVARDSHREGFTCRPHDRSCTAPSLTVSSRHTPDRIWDCLWSSQAHVSGLVSSRMARSRSTCCIMVDSSRAHCVSCTLGSAALAGGLSDLGRSLPGSRVCLQTRAACPRAGHQSVSEPPAVFRRLWSCWSSSLAIGLHVELANCSAVHLGSASWPHWQRRR